MIGRSTWSLAIHSLGIALLFAFVSGPLNGQDEKKSVKKTKAESIEKTIIGSWTGNAEESKKYWKAKKIDGPERMAADASNLTISFLDGNKLAVRNKRNGGEDFQAEGTYKVLKKDEDKKYIKVLFVPSKEGGPDELEVEIQVLTVNMKIALAITPKNDPALVFFKEDPADKKEGGDDKKGDEKKPGKDKSAEKKSEGENKKSNDK